MKRFFESNEGMAFSVPDIEQHRGAITADEPVVGEFG